MWAGIDRCASARQDSESKAVNMVTLCPRPQGMQTFLALAATALACVLAQQPATPDDPPAVPPEFQKLQPQPMSSRDFLMQFAIPQFILSRSLGYKEAIKITQPLHNDLLDEEIDYINQMDSQEEEEANSYEDYYPSWKINDSPTNYVGSQYPPATQPPIIFDQKPDDTMPGPLKLVDNRKENKEIVNEDLNKNSKNNTNNTTNPRYDFLDLAKTFAMTPLEEGYYEFYGETDEESSTPKEDLQEEDNVDTMLEPRDTRQNPNLGKAKHLLAEQVDKLRTGFTYEDSEGTAKPHPIRVLDSPVADPAESIYGVALLAAIGAAVTVAIVGFAFGWYTLSMKAKAAAEVDYPAYGVTGPSVDASGDRKLAQSAHMYHYQHQKQQIIAMERNGMERNGSVSDPESEEENEEGDYTVYECPGFATTGNMEVKNPLFNEEPTPATPGKSDGENALHKE